MLKQCIDRKPAETDHAPAAVLLEAGAHPKLVQDLLGHSTVALTSEGMRIKESRRVAAVRERQRAVSLP